MYSEGKCIRSFGGEILKNRTTWKKYRRWVDNIEIILKQGLKKCEGGGLL